MNGETATILNKVAKIYQKRTKSLKRKFNSLTHKEKEKAMVGFNSMIRKHEIKQRVIREKKKIEEKKVVDRLESKLKKGKDEKTRNES